MLIKPAKKPSTKIQRIRPVAHRMIVAKDCASGDTHFAHHNTIVTPDKNRLPAHHDVILSSEKACHPDRSPRQRPGKPKPRQERPAGASVFRPVKRNRSEGAHLAAAEPALSEGEGLERSHRRSGFLSSGPQTRVNPQTTANRTNHEGYPMQPNSPSLLH